MILSRVKDMVSLLTFSDHLALVSNSQIFSRELIIFRHHSAEATSGLVHRVLYHVCCRRKRSWGKSCEFGHDAEESL